MSSFLSFVLVVPTRNPGGLWPHWLGALRQQQPGATGLVVDSSSNDGTDFTSLPQGFRLLQIAAEDLSDKILDLMDETDDFADTAAIIANLDLVISVDTAVAHLAGALGKPCWVLLPDYRTDWRWLVGRDDSPWYPGVVRLFRQPPGGGWGPVVISVVEALRQWKYEWSASESGSR